MQNLNFQSRGKYFFYTAFLLLLALGLAALAWDLKISWATVIVAASFSYCSLEFYASLVEARLGKRNIWLLCFLLAAKLSLLVVLLVCISADIAQVWAALPALFITPIALIISRQYLR